MRCTLLLSNLAIVFLNIVRTWKIQSFICPRSKLGSRYRFATKGWKHAEALFEIGQRLRVTIVNMSTYNFDISAGAGSLSTPPSEAYDEVVFPAPKLSFRAQQLVRKLIKKVPDFALVGLLVLMSSELLRREVESKTSLLPSSLKELVNSTVTELETKIDILSSYEYDVDPFIKYELEYLKELPFETIDKFIVNDILPKIDKELSPYLSKLMGNTEDVTAVTKNIKELIELTTMLMLGYQSNTDNSSTSHPLHRTTATILEQVDTVGAGIEEG